MAAFNNALSMVNTFDKYISLRATRSRAYIARSRARKPSGICKANYIARSRARKPSGICEANHFYLHNKCIN